VFQPEFYLSDATLKGAEELAGQHELGSEIISDGTFENPATFIDLRDRIVKRTQAFAHFIYGVSQSARQDVAQAKQALELADTPAWDDRDGKEVLYLFLGSAAGMQKEWATARSYYERALALRPGYARALLGLAQVQFVTAGPTRDCASSAVDADALLRVKESLAAVASAPVQPAVSYVPEKAQYLLGQLNLCFSQAGIENRFAEAKQDLQGFIAAFEGGKSGLRDLAAEAHASLGLLAFPAEDEQDPSTLSADYAHALAEYTKAIELSQHRERQAELWVMVGYLHAQLGDGKAEDSYATAMRLDPAHRSDLEGLRRQYEQS
jgi:tetratricopeptide (TPR) repeat protein